MTFVVYLSTITVVSGLTFQKNMRHFMESEDKYIGMEL